MAAPGRDGDGGRTARDRLAGEAATSARLLRARAATDLWIDVDGPSMAPRLVPPARVLVRATARPPRVGEVWAFVADDRTLVVHRCAGRRRGRLVFVGDANETRDPLVREHHLVGRVVAVDRSGTTTPVRRVAGVLPLVAWSLRATRRRLNAERGD